ncbi:hypothetical protein Tco_1280040 [Tanacetum coccineum]
MKANRLELKVDKNSVHMPGQSKKSKKSVTTKDKNPSQPSASTSVVTELHKEALQETNGQTSLGVTGEVRADPQLSSVMSTSTTEPVYSASTLVHSESSSGRVTSTTFIVEVDP